MFKKILFIGRLGQDPEKRMLPSGESVVTYSLATSTVWKDRNTGERKESTEWHRVTLFRGLADIAARVCRDLNSSKKEGFTALSSLKSSYRLPA